MIKSNHKLSVDIDNLSDKKMPEKDTIMDWLYCALKSIDHDILETKNNLELSIRVVDKFEMTELNHEFRNKNRATNVLSFPSK